MNFGGRRTPGTHNRTAARRYCPPRQRGQYASAQPVFPFPSRSAGKRLPTLQKESPHFRTQQQAISLLLPAEMPWVDVAKVRAANSRKQREYSEQVETWLTVNFPDLCEPKSGAHPAAIVAVYDLHVIHGRGSLTKHEHGDVIRRQVEKYEAKWGPIEESEQWQL